MVPSSAIAEKEFTQIDSGATAQLPTDESAPKRVHLLVRVGAHLESVDSVQRSCSPDSLEAEVKERKFT